MNRIGSGAKNIIMYDLRKGGFSVLLCGCMVCLVLEMGHRAALFVVAPDYIEAELSERIAEQSGERLLKCVVVCL